MVEGKNTDDLQYVMEMGDNLRIYAYFLLYVFGDIARGNRDHNMFGNKEVMEIWAQFSDEGMTRVAAEEHLMWANGKV